MQTARIERRVGVRATPDRIWNLIEEFDGWSRWNPHETEVSGVIAFGGKIELTERLPGLTDRRVQGAIAEWQPRAQLVWAEKRGLWFNVLRYFEIEQLGPENCILAVGAAFSGLRGELHHDRHRRALKAAYETIAENLKTAAEA